jgi:high-affinity nickel permease
VLAGVRGPKSLALAGQHADGLILAEPVTPAYLQFVRRSYAVLSLPILFAAGMSLFDTADGWFMNFAYDWAFARPVRQVYYNLTGSGWAWLENFNINTAGFVIVGVFVMTCAAALSIWHFGKM